MSLGKYEFCQFAGIQEVDLAVAVNVIVPRRGYGAQNYQPKKYKVEDVHLAVPVQISLDGCICCFRRYEHRGKSKDKSSQRSYKREENMFTPISVIHIAPP